MVVFSYLGGFTVDDFITPDMILHHGVTPNMDFFHFSDIVNGKTITLLPCWLLRQGKYNKGFKERQSIIIYSTSLKASSLVNTGEKKRQ